MLEEGCCDVDAVTGSEREESVPSSSSLWWPTRGEEGADPDSQTEALAPSRTVARVTRPVEEERVEGVRERGGRSGEEEEEREPDEFLLLAVEAAVGLRYISE